MSLLMTFLNVRQAGIWGRKLWQSFYRPLFLAIVRFGRKSAPSTSGTQYPEKGSSKNHKACFTQIKEEDSLKYPQELGHVCSMHHWTREKMEIDERRDKKEKEMKAPGGLAMLPTPASGLRGNWMSKPCLGFPAALGECRANRKEMSDRRESPRGRV